MSCMGPSINEEELKRAYSDIMDLLNKNYDIQAHEPSFSVGRMKAFRETINAEFMAALRDVFMQQACEDF